MDADRHEPSLRPRQRAWDRLVKRLSPAWLGRIPASLILDAGLVLTAVLMIVTPLTVFFFHIVFVLLSLQAFVLRFRPFVLRAVPWIAFTTLVVAAAVFTGQTQSDELIEIPLLSMIIACVFAISAERRRYEDHLALLATRDSLTGLANRTVLRDQVRDAVERARRTHEPFALAFIDLDDFKLVNDRHGHSAGDELLKTAALRLVDALRTSDTVARMGGDEFAALLLDVSSREKAEEVAQRLVAAFDAPFTVAGVDLRVPASLGIVVSDGTEEFGEVLRRADATMYEAKRAGKARFRVRHFEQG